MQQWRQQRRGRSPRRARLVPGGGPGVLSVSIRCPSGSRDTRGIFKESCCQCGAPVRKRCFFTQAHTELTAGRWFFVDLVWRNALHVQVGAVCVECGGNCDRARNRINCDQVLLFLPKFLAA